MPEIYFDNANPNNQDLASSQGGWAQQTMDYYQVDNTLVH